jgi:hypothetical protein
VSWPLLAETALAVTVYLFVLLLALGLARAAAESDRIERRAVSRRSPASDTIAMLLSP